VALPYHILVISRQAKGSLGEIPHKWARLIFVNLMFNSIPNFSKNAPTTNRLPPLHAAEATLEYFDESE